MWGSWSGSGCDDAFALQDLPHILEHSSNVVLGECDMNQPALLLNLLQPSSKRTIERSKPRRLGTNRLRVLRFLGRDVCHQLLILPSHDEKRH